MPAAIPTRLRLTADDKLAMADYWRFYEPIHLEVSSELRQSLAGLPEWAPILAAQKPAEIAEQDRRSLELQRAALIDGNWAPYLQDLHTQGATYARMGVTFIAWYDVIGIWREVLRRRLGELARSDLARAQRIGDGMNRFVDIAMSHLGEAYLATKEQIIVQQQDAIRELSMPILQVRPGLLITPLVGLIDATRGRQLVETLLVAIRDSRARGIVIDVTGVPTIDTAAANYLVQAAQAARLMGATVVITGVSAEMAQTLVSLRANLPDAHTLVDLQDGIQYIGKLLGHEQFIVQ